MQRLHHIVNQLRSEHKTNIHEIECKNSTQYQYTMDGFAEKVLTSEQRDFYEKNGYIVIRGLLPEKDVDLCNKRFDDLVLNPSLRVPEMLVMRDISLKQRRKNLSQHRTKSDEVTKLQKFAFDPVFYENYLSHPKIIPYVQAFIGKDVRSYHHMYINKPTDPGTLSSRHPLHQDLWYFPVSDTNRVVACWTALQNVDRNNGGLCLIPGSHSNPGYVLVHDYPKWHGPSNHLYVSVPDNEYRKVARNRVHLDMKKGDTVFFHGLAIHGSSANLTNRFRRSLCCHFINSMKCRYQPFIRSDQTKYGKLIAGGNMGKVSSKQKGKKSKNIKKKAKEQLTKTQGTYKRFFQLKSRQIIGDCGDWELNDKEFKEAEKHWFKRKMNRNEFGRNPNLNVDKFQ